MVASAAVLAIAASPQAALADGDPASDVLIGQNAFLPWDAGATPAQQTRLTAILGAAAHAGYPIRVAVIASRSDLGSVTALWRRPRLYARFLDVELMLAYKGPVLVAMPNGIGVASGEPLSAAERAAVSAVGAGSIAPTHLAAVAQRAVEKLAAAAGHPLPAAAISSTAAPTAADTSSTGTIAYLVLALGAVLIVGAWIASLRARPPRSLANRRAAS